MTSLWRSFLTEGTAARGDRPIRVTLIHNHKAGVSSNPLTAERLMALIRQAGHLPVYQSSKEKNWEAILEEPTDLVAVAGGDGTVAKVGKLLSQQDIPMTILPLGNANNVFKTLYPAHSVEDLIAGSPG